MMMPPMFWRCPLCRRPLTQSGTTLVCGACEQRYPRVGDIPDLRVTGASWVDRERDRAEAQRLLERAGTGTTEDLIRSVFAARDGWAAARVWARTRDVLAAPRRTRRAFDSWLAPVTSRQDVVLDVGCGPGALLAATPVGRAAVGVDVSLVWLVVADRVIREAGRVPVLAAAMGEALPLADESMGAVVSLDVIEHVGAPDRYLREIDRVLKPGGCLALSTPNRFSLAAEPHVGVWGVGWLPRAWQGWYVSVRSGQPYDAVALLSARELRHALAAHTSCTCVIVAPPLHDDAVADFPPYRRRLARLYNAISRAWLGRQLLLLVGAFFQVVGVKRDGPPTSSR